MPVTLRDTSLTRLTSWLASKVPVVCNSSSIVEAFTTNTSVATPVAVGAGVGVLLVSFSFLLEKTLGTIISKATTKMAILVKSNLVRLLNVFIGVGLGFTYRVDSLFIPLEKNYHQG